MAVACIPCKRKKCKCDTTKPYCTQCKIRGKACAYDLVGDRRKRSYKDFEELSRTVAVQRELLNTILSGGPKSEALIKKLQEDKESVMQGKLEDTPKETSAINRETNIFTSDDGGKISYYGETSNIPIIVTNNKFTIAQVKTDTLNSKTVPILVQEDLILELLSLYFCWQQPYFNILDQNLFLRDMNVGGRYYSNFLLNCILAKASHFCGRPECRTDPNDPATAGGLFYKTAIDMLPQELENATITTVQGLLLLATKESGMAKISLGWIHSGMAFRIAIDLGLHLDNSSLIEKGIISQEEDLARRTTFWGCYVFDQGWGFYLGRPRAIQELDITLKFPTYCEEAPVPWSPFYEGVANIGTNLPVNCYYPKNTMTAIIHLYRLLKNVVVDIYTENTKKDYRTLLEHHFEKLGSWSAELPKTLACIDGPMHPAVIMLHTMYHSSVIFLFRPYLKIGRSEWKHETLPAPRDISLKCAHSILKLLQSYKELYSLRKILNLASYVTSTATTVYFSLGCTDYWEELKSFQEIFAELGTSWPDSNMILERINARIAKDGMTEPPTINRGEAKTPNLQTNYFEPDNFMFNDEFFLNWNLFDP